MMAGMNADENSTPPNTAYRSGVKIVPPSIYTVVFAAGFLLQHFFPMAVLPNAVGRCIALACLLPGTILCVWALVCFRLGRTSPLPIRPSTALVTTGPYRFIRNPMYVGLGFLYVGLALWFQIVWALVLLPVAIGIIRYRVIAPEEKYLEQKFGTEYLDYKARVPRWFTRLGL